MPSHFLSLWDALDHSPSLFFSCVKARNLPGMTVEIHLPKPRVLSKSHTMGLVL